MEKAYKEKFFDVWDKVREYYQEKREYDKKYEKIRLNSIDVLRGILVLVSIFIIFQGLRRHINLNLLVSKWNGLSLGDFIFPGFLMVMGMSLPFFIKKNYLDGATVSEIFKKIITRAIMLFVLGMIYSILFMPSNGFVRLTGPYQVLAISYLICSLMYLGFLKLKIKNNALTYIFIIIGVIISAVFTFVAFRNGHDIKNSIFVVLDNSIIRNFKSPRLADPYGLLVCFSSIPITMFGLSMGCILNKKPIHNKKYIRYKRTRMVRREGFSRQNLWIDIKNAIHPKSIKSILSNYYRINDDAKKIVNLLIMAIVFYTISKVVGIFVPLNRNVFSLSFSMRVASYMFILLDIFFILFDVIKIENLTILVKRIGKNSILILFFISFIYLLFSLIKIKSLYTGQWLDINTWFTTDFILPITGIDYASETYSLVWTIIWLLLCNLLEKFDIKVNV